MKQPLSARSSFLLTPLREGRLLPPHGKKNFAHISTHAPAGGATRQRLGRLLMNL